MFFVQLRIFGIWKLWLSLLLGFSTVKDSFKSVVPLLAEFTSVLRRNVVVKTKKIQLNKTTRS